VSASGATSGFLASGLERRKGGSGKGTSQFKWGADSRGKPFFSTPPTV
jgi:hypothetical protein